MSAGARPTPVLRPLTEADGPALASFPCQDYRAPWSTVVEELVRERLAPNLADSAVSATGLWSDGVLCGVAAWRVDGDLCRSIVVAVRTGYRRRGLGRVLKDAVVAHARAAGARAVASTVHWDNEAMIELNITRGANVERIPGDRDFCRCVIPLVD